MVYKMVSLDTYGNYNSGNYGAHCMCLGIGALTLWFSYKTVIAYRDHSNGNNEFKIRINDWKTTTGKHLNAIDTDKSKRISGEEFEKALGECLTRHGLTLN